jgi:hypothetical protein
MISTPRRKSLVLSVCTFLALPAISSARAQETPSRSRSAPPAAQQISPEVRQQITAVISAPTAEAKLKALTSFMSAHPESPVRWRLLFHVGTAISRVKEPSQQVPLAEKFLTLVASGHERDYAAAILADACLSVGRVDDAFRTAVSVGDDQALGLELLVRLASAAADEVRNRNVQHLAAGRNFGTRAIDLFAANRRPPAMSPAEWTGYKSRTMPLIYQMVGLLEMHAGALAAAKSHLQKAAELAPSDPQNFFTLGALLSGEFRISTERLQALPAGPERDAVQQKTDMVLDELIDAYARAVALTEGRPEYESARAKLTEDLQNYYRSRHNGSLDGLQVLIEKYRQK